MKKYLIAFFVLVISISGVCPIFAQEKQKIPADFFMGKWGGTISGAVVVKDAVFPFSLELIGHPAKLGIGLFGGGATAWLKMVATWPGKFTLVDTSVGCLFVPDYSIFTIDYSLNEPASMAEMGYNAIFSLAGFTAHVENKNLILLISGGADKDMWEDSWAKGELHRIERKKCEEKYNIALETILSTMYTSETEILPNGTTIQKTVDKIKIVTGDGCVEIYITEHSKITASDGTEMEILTRKLLDGVISSHLYKGHIEVNVWKDGKHHNFSTKKAIVDATGTDFILKADEDGTTTLTVIDGEVEFSDINKKNTVIVKKNQRSVIKPDGLPSEPVSIDPNQIPRWWE